MEALLSLIGLLVLIPALFIYSSFSYGWAFYKFWYWFLLPVFPQLPHIGFLTSVGLFMFTAMFKSQTSEGIKEEYKENKWTRLAIGTVIPWIVLTVGWFIHLFIK